MARQFVQTHDLAEFIRSAFGTARKLDAVDRLAGGTQKGVYRLTLDDSETAILYAWSDATRSRPRPVWTCSGPRGHGWTPSAYPLR